MYIPSPWDSKSIPTEELQPPLTRYLREDGGCGTCVKCGSSMVRTIPFFGVKKCTHPKCRFEI